MKILGLDPGHTTGWAVVTEEKILYKGFFPHYEEVTALLAEHEPDIAVVEDFLLYPWKSQQLAWNNMKTVQNLGVIRYLLDEADVPYVLQAASLVKKHSRRLPGSYSSAHERDAVTHAIVYLVRQGLASDALKRLIWRRGP